MYTLNNKLKKVEPYDPVDGDYRIRLDANESCFNINDELGNKITDAVKKINLNRYPDPLAKEACKAFSGFYGIPDKFVTAGNGSDELISIISSTFLEKGDKILTLSPDFSMYAFYGSLYELKVETIHKGDDLNVSISKVIEYCNNNNVKAVIFSNPCNPTSLGVLREDIIRLVKNVFCLVIIDEAYMDFWNQSILDTVKDFDNLIVLKTCSKAAGLAAIRLGFAVAGEKITSALRAVKSPYNTDAVSQALGTIALSEKELLARKCSEIVSNRKELQNEIIALSKEFPKLGRVYDSVTNFVFIKTPAGKAIYEKLLEKSISIRYMGNYIRITAGTKEENTELIIALKDILEELK